MRSVTHRRRQHAGAAASPLRRRGIASVLAMLYLVIFVALALGFYAQVTVSAQLALNERRGAEAQIAAESGMAFVRQRLATVEIAPWVAPELVLKEIHTLLSPSMNFSGNLGTRVIAYSNGVVDIPAGAGEFIQLQPNGPWFHATLSDDGNGGVRAKITGADATKRFRRAVQVEFRRAPKPSTIFDYGVATRGSISLSSARIKGDPAALGDVLSAGASSTSVGLGGSSAGIDGKVYLTHPGGIVTGDGSVNGVSDPALRPAGVVPNTPSPDFPGSDPTPYIKYLQGKETLITGSSSATYLANIRIKAGANPTFSSGVLIEGVILVEAPNQISFAGGSTLRAVIVSANPQEGTATNSITFSGGATMEGVQALAASFGDLKTMTGVSILAPNFNVLMTGGSSTFGGTVLAKSLVVSGGAGGRVTGNVILTGTSPLNMSGGSEITIAPAGTTGVPTGILFTYSYAINPKSYLEVSP